MRLKQTCLDKSNEFLTKPFTRESIKLLSKEIEAPVLEITSK